jgi:hypothetical protein
MPSLKLCFDDDTQDFSKVENNGSIEDVMIKVQSDTRREIMELAQFYQKRNQARVNEHKYSLFPISYEHEHESDPNLPKVLPPFLPPKT